MSAIQYRRANVDGLNIFYREAGSAGKPKLLLLHGYPSSGHMFRDLIPLLSDRFHIIAPDLPGFGQSDMPSRDQFSYTFDNIANVIDRFTEVVGFDRFAVYVFDYGAPTGFRIAVKHHRHHFAERQCIRRRIERRLESDSGLLERTFRGKS
jgi:pimeloyl-ACP methyl ester carboxylesterase